MSRQLWMAVALTAAIVARAEDNSALQPLLSQDRAIAGVWSLDDKNITTEITEAYRYRDNIIVFGWAGNYNGVVTIVDANAGKEKLELLVNERSRFITTSGILIYAHWFVKGVYEPDDSLWLLNLNRPFASHKSVSAWAGYVEEVGVRIYPRVKDSNARHQFGQPVVTKDGRDVFLADRTVHPAKPDQVCFVHISVSDVDHPVEKHNCVEEKRLPGYSAGPLQVTKLELRSSGELVYLVTSRSDPGGKTQEFTINKDNLSVAPAGLYN